MSNPADQADDKLFVNRTSEAAIRLGLITLLVFWCYLIISPFIILVLWGAIIAVAIYPLYLKLQALLGGRKNLAATVYTLLTLAFLITPTVMISDSLIQTSQTLADELHQGSLVIPPPDKSVAEWPLVGEQIHTVWSQASTNLEATLKEYAPQLKQAGQALIAVATGAGGAVLQFIVSVIISGLLLANTSGAYNVSVKIFQRLTDAEQGMHLVELAKATIRSVAQGVLGVAIIQAVLAALGMYIMDVPGWGLWTLLVLILAIAQIPPILILGPVIAYVFTVADAAPAVIFAIWSVIVSMSDGFLKPLFLGRGMETPMLVILLGAIGGMLLNGIIGLFVGAIILALGYEIFMAWLNKDLVANKEMISEAQE